MYAERYYWGCATASSSVSWKGQAAIKWNGAMSLVIRMGLVFSPLFFWVHPPFFIWLRCESQLKETYGEKHRTHRRVDMFFLLNYGDSFPSPRMLKCTWLVRILIIPPSHYPIAETFLFLFSFFLFFFSFSVHPFRAVDTDSWQMSEIIIVVIFFLVIYHLPDRMSKALNFNFALFCSEANYACLRLRLP